MARDESSSGFARRTALSALVLIATWAVSKLLDLGTGGLWTGLKQLGGVPLAVGGVVVAGLAVSALLGIAAGRVRFPGQRIRIRVSWLPRYVPYAVADLALLRRVSRGAGNRRWDAREDFEAEDPKRIGNPDQLHSSFGWWHERGRGSFRVSFIHCTGEFVAVGPEPDGAPVELLGHARDEHHADRLLDSWHYVRDLRWVRLRLRGWRIPVPPHAKWWQEFDERPPQPWPLPPPPSVGRSVGAYYGRNGDDLDYVVEIVDEAGRRPLYHAVDSSPTGVSWGYLGAGPTDMARSLLLDRLGYVPQQSVVYEFRNEVVVALQDQFVLTFDEVDTWIDEHGALFAEDPRADPLDPYAAGGAD